MERVGRAVPDGVWLEALTLETDAQKALRLTLEGGAYQEEDIALYLERLEQAPFSTTVQLLYAEAIQGRSRYRQAAAADRPFTRFEVQLGVARPSFDVEASE